MPLLLARPGAKSESEPTRRANQCISFRKGHIGEAALIDPHVCRTNAAECIEMASKAHGDVERQATLCDSAEMWLRLADRFERGVANTATGLLAGCLSRRGPVDEARFHVVGYKGVA